MPSDSEAMVTMVTSRLLLVVNVLGSCSCSYEVRQVVHKVLSTYSRQLLHGYDVASCTMSIVLLCMPALGVVSTMDCQRQRSTLVLPGNKVIPVVETEFHRKWIPIAPSC